MVGSGDDLTPELDVDVLRRLKRAAWLQREALAMRAGAGGRSSGRAMVFRRYAVYLEEIVAADRNDVVAGQDSITLAGGGT